MKPSFSFGHKHDMSKPHSLPIPKKPMAHVVSATKTVVSTFNGKTIRSLPSNRKTTPSSAHATYNAKPLVSKPVFPAPVLAKKPEVVPTVTIPAEQAELETMARGMRSLVKNQVLHGTEWVDKFKTTESLSYNTKTIGKPGYYMLEEAITLSKKSAPIVISSSYVIIDMRGLAIQFSEEEESEGIESKAAIIIESGCDHVMIANGVIQHPNRGILVKGGVKNLTLRDTIIKGTREGAIVCEESETPTIVTKNILIEKIRIENCPVSTFGISMNHVENAIIDYVLVNIESSKTNCRGISVKNSSKILLGPRIKVQNVTGTSVAGIEVDNCSEVIMDGVRVSHAEATEASTYGVLVKNSSRKIFLKKIRVDTLSAGKEQSAYGVFIDESSELVPSDLSHVHVSVIQSPSPILSHHIVIDGRVSGIGSIADDVTESEITTK